MTVLVVGSVAYDSVQTPAGTRSRALGGSATYFSIAASYFADVSLVGVVGRDFSDLHVDLLRSRGIETSGLDRVDGDTFHWAGVYSTEDMNQRETLDTQLNVFGEFKPILSPAQRGSSYVFLANIDPALQFDVLDQMSTRPNLVALDSMDFWINGKRDSLDRIVAGVDVFFVDEGEARSYAREVNIVAAARAIQSAGPRIVVIKRGEHGVLVLDGADLFAAPALPLERVVDPTGAGDSFAGGFMGMIAATGDISVSGIRRAAVVGTVMGSFAVQDFSADRLSALSNEDIQERFAEFVRLTSFDGVETEEELPFHL